MMYAASLEKILIMKQAVYVYVGIIHVKQLEKRGSLLNYIRLN